MNKSFTPEAIDARRRLCDILDRISPATYGSNTNLVEAIEELIAVLIREALQRK